MRTEPELTRRVERCRKLLQKGKAAEALEEYLLVLRDDPENDKVGELAADLCLSQNRGRDAVRLLGELFERQVNGGDATRASLTYRGNWRGMVVRHVAAEIPLRTAAGRDRTKSWQWAHMNPH